MGFTPGSYAQKVLSGYRNLAWGAFRRRGVITPNLPKEFTSGSMLSGDFATPLRNETFSWWFAYIDLYRDFLENHSDYPILKEPAIIEEGKKTRALFLGNFAKAAPRILGDIPNLNTPERGVRLGELLFLDG